MSDKFIINSASSRVVFDKYVDDMQREHGYITFSPPRIGADRSLDQNSLFHVWLTDYVAHSLRIHKKEVSKGLLQGMKDLVKQKFTAKYPDCYHWMVYEVISPITNEVTRKEYTSSKSWKKGEMFMVLTWFQMTAAEDGLILEAKGQFAKAQRESNGA